MLTKQMRFSPAFLLIVIALVASGCADGDWRKASRESAGLAPNPATTEEAVLQVYGADAWSWRGWFAIHTWIAAKKRGQDHYLVYDVVGWREKRGEPVMKVYRDVPDRLWFGERPKVIGEYRGEGVDALIDKVDVAALAYPWKQSYKVFPGPNSNTFVGWVSRKVPELKLKLPFSAIGSGYEE